MSTVFEVFPSVNQVPTFSEVLSRSSRHVNAFLRECGIHTFVKLSAGMRSNNEESRVLPINLDGPCWWPEDQYAWFHVPGIAGGTDAYANVMHLHDAEDLGQSILTHEISAEKAGEFAELIRRSLQVGKHWGFRRSAGQPAIINIAYGMIAASLAELTEGIIHSIDGAWDHRLLPARPIDFLTWYFRPELMRDPGEREWVERCIKHLPDELAKATDER
jgi:hypothetical protein